MEYVLDINFEYYSVEKESIVFFGKKMKNEMKKEKNKTINKSDHWMYGNQNETEKKIIIHVCESEREKKGRQFSFTKWMNEMFTLCY